MRYNSIALIIIVAIIALSAVLVVANQLMNPVRPLIVFAEFEPSHITPNADGVDDVTRLNYEISKPSWVSIVFEAQDGTQYHFRERQPRDAGTYGVLFSGVVNGFTLDDDDFEGDVLRRLMPNGAYTWRITAESQADSQDTMQLTGDFMITDGTSEVPKIIEFTVSPPVFTPNQDGVSDRTQINVYVNKEHESLDVYLVSEEGVRIPVIRREEGRKMGEAGRHQYDYEGGVDIGADPPADGVYTVIAELRDYEGQITRRTTTLEIRDGGIPLAEIRGQNVGATVVFVAQPYDARYYSDQNGLGDLIDIPDTPSDVNALPITMPLGDLLVFKLTVDNYGSAPIRTSGPPPGTVYDFGQRASSLGQLEQSGVWRVGIDCETSIEASYPWRWALGDADSLEQVQDPVTGNTYYYLPAGGQTVVWGAIRMTEYNRFANPQACWAGLIHEDVGISTRNNNVGRREIQILPVGE
jgi:hypothetical protein